jgi:glycosyltransferase involved in cell wall biosynthesis
VLISVAIPAFNEDKLLGETLAAVDAAGAAFRTRGWKMEVVVCDNNSTDRTAAIAEAAGARVVFEAENQISRSRNAGGNAARGGLDYFPRCGFHAVRRALCRHGGFDGNGKHPRRRRGDSDGIDAVVGGDCLGIWNLISRVFRWPTGSYIFCRAEAFRELEGFSPKLYAAEEIEFDHRFKRLARQRQQRIHIIRRPPLLSSNRRMVMYSPFRLLWFMLVSTFTAGLNLRRRATYNWWYDGQR